MSVPRVSAIPERYCLCLGTREGSWGTLKCNHQFHSICAGPWIREWGICPICRRVENLTFHKNKQAQLAQAAGESLLIHAVKRGYLEIVQDLLENEEISDNDYEDAIAYAATNGLKDRLKDLIQTDRHRGIAYGWSLRNHRELCGELLREAENRTAVHKFAIMALASKGRNEVFELLQTPQDQARAVAFSIPEHLGLFNQIKPVGNEDWQEVRKLAIGIAAFHGRVEALGHLIETDEDRAYAMIWVAPRDRKVLSFLFANAIDRDALLQAAYRMATNCDREDELKKTLKHYSRSGCIII